MYTVFWGPKTLVKNLAKNLVKNLSKIWAKNLGGNLDKGVGPLAGYTFFFLALGL